MVSVDVKPNVFISWGGPGLRLRSYTCQTFACVNTWHVRNSCIRQYYKDVLLVEFMYLVFTRMPGGVTVGGSGHCCVPCLWSAIISLWMLIRALQDLAKEQGKGEEDKADRGRGGKTTSGNGQAWSSASPRGQWRTGENGENWLQNHLWCPDDPRG